MFSPFKYSRALMESTQSAYQSKGTRTEGNYCAGKHDMNCAVNLVSGRSAFRYPSALKAASPAAALVAFAKSSSKTPGSRENSECLPLARAGIEYMVELESKWEWRF